MNLEMLSEKQKSIVKQEIFRKLVLTETKRRVSKKDYALIKENYDLLLIDYDQKSAILSEGARDYFASLIQGVKKLGDKLNPNDEELVKKLEAQLETLIRRSSELREQYVQFQDAQKEVAKETDGKTDTTTDVKIEKIRIEADKLDKQARQLAERVNAIRKKYKLPPIDYKIDGVPPEQQNDNIPDIVQGSDDGKFEGGDSDGAGSGGDSGKKPGAKRNSQGVPDNVPVPPEIKKIEDDFENPKAPGIFRSIIDSYKYAFGANAAMWKGIYNWFGKAEKAPRRNQDDLLIKLLDLLIAQAEKKGTPVPDDVKKPDNDEEGGDNDEEGEEGKEGDKDKEGKDKPKTVKDIQDKIILAINKVFDTKNVDISRKDTMELAKTITKNLVDQLGAQGVEFRGVKAKALQENVYRTLNKIMEGKVSQRFAGGKKEKYLDPKMFVKTLEKVRRHHYKTLNLNNTDTFEEYKDSEEDQEWMGFYGHYLDLKKLKSLEGKVLKSLTDKDDQLKDKIKMKGKTIGAMLKKFELYYRDRNSPKQMQRYKELLKKTSRERLGGKDAKDMYKPEKVKTFELPKGKKGQINVKNLIFQALKGLNMDSKQVQDIESLLNKRLQGVVKQYLEKGMDTKVLEEKINRQIKHTVRILNNAM